jgi:hypothetical protein
MDCVKAHFQDFTEPCKAALVRVAAVREACGVDIDERCPAIKPGAGRILLCIKKHFASLALSTAFQVSRARPISLSDSSNCPVMLAPHWAA